VSDEDPREAFARLQAKVDQLVSSSGEVSRVVSSYFNSLLLQGLERQECLALTLGWQSHLLENSQPDELLDADDE
jgi:hypothetical protein